MGTINKYVFLFFISILTINYSFSQTAQIEKDYIQDLYETGQITLEEFRAIGKLWGEMMEDIGFYPELPYYESLGIIKFEYVQNYTADKEIIFTRIKEWAALTFGSSRDVLHHEDLNTGKIILKGYFNIPYKKDVKIWFKENETLDNSKCSHTYIFTIKDNRLKIQITGLDYEIDYWTSYGTRTLRKSVHSLYPITADNSMQWKSKITLLKNTNTEINGLVNHLDNYISSYKSDYDF